MTHTYDAWYFNNDSLELYPVNLDEINRFVNRVDSNGLSKYFSSNFFVSLKLKMIECVQAAAGAQILTCKNGVFVLSHLWIFYV